VRGNKLSKRGGSFVKNSMGGEPLRVNARILENLAGPIIKEGEIQVGEKHLV